MRHETQSEDASLEENSKRLRWLVFSVPETVAKRGLSFKGRYFCTIDRGESLFTCGIKTVAECLPRRHSGRKGYLKLRECLGVLNL